MSARSAIGLTAFKKELIAEHREKSFTAKPSECSWWKITV